MNTQVKITVKVKHDNGTAKINVYASSIDEAKDKVMKSENCPLSAIIYAKVAPLTIYDIKILSEDSSPYFFSRKTLHFFKQTVGSFKVNRWGNDKFYIYARSFGGNTTERIFNPFTNELEHLPVKTN